ncbi:MAG: MlaD family protein [Planctomycetota bacterium]
MNRTHFSAGLFTLVCLLGLLVSSVVLSGVGDLLSPSTGFGVVFPLSQGTQGLQAGADVTLGGQKVGRVTGVGFERDGRGSPMAVVARVRVRDDLLLFEDARVELVRPLLGAGASINIAAAGAGELAGFQGTGPEVADGESLPGLVAAPSFLADAGFGEDQKLQLQNLVANAETASLSARALLESLERQAPAAAESLNEFLARSEGWGDRIDAILESVGSAAGNADVAVVQAREALQELRGIVADNRAVIAEAVASLNRSATEIENGAVPDVAEILASARAAVASVELATDEAASILVGNRPSIDRAVANVRLATDQLKLLSIEVRRTPWRALQRPSTKELREQLVYDAAQAYLLASVELASTGDTLAAAVERGPEDIGVEELRAKLSESVRAYEAAAERLLERLDPVDD